MSGKDHSAASLVEQARLQKALRESEILRELADILNSSLDLKHILQELVKRTTELCEVARCAVWILEENRLSFQPSTYYIAGEKPFYQALRDGDAIWYSSSHLSLNSSLVQNLQASDGMLYVEDLRAEPQTQSFAETFRTYSVLLVSLTREGQPVGMLSLDNPGEVRAFSQEQQQLARAIGQQATIAIANARLYQQAQAQQMRARAIYQVAMTVNSGEELPVILRMATRHLVQSLGASDGHVLLLDTDQLILHQVSSDHRDGEPKIAASGISLASFPNWQHAVYTGRSVMVRAKQALGAETSWFQQGNMRNMLLVPLMSGFSHERAEWELPDDEQEEISLEEGQTTVPLSEVDCLGLIVVFYARRRKLSRGEYAFAHDIAVQCALAIKKAHVLKEAHQALETFLHIAEAVSLSHSTDIHDILQSVLDKTLMTLHCTRGTVYLYDQEGKTFNLIFSLGFPAEEQAFWLEQQQIWLNPESGRASNYYQRLLGGHATLIKAESGDPLASTMVLAAPIRHNQRILGLILLDRLLSSTSSQTQAFPRFTNWDITIAEGIAQLAGVAMERARWQQEAVDARSSESAMREADALKNEFLAITAHEFRNPLAVILGSSQASLRSLRRNRKNEPVPVVFSSIEEHLEIIASQAKQLNNIVATFLDAARINRGQFALKSEVLDLREIVRQIIEDQANVVEIHTLSYIVDERDAPYLVMGDKARLAQIITNLIENAIKYSPLGGPITVNLRRYRNGETVEMIETCIEDRGMGIPPEVQSRLFERFYRAPTATSGETRGVGLGLYIVAQLVKAHGGDIHVESAGKMGDGSRFVFTLPIFKNIEPPYADVGL
jgi:signal transduction histidine kinase